MKASTMTREQATSFSTYSPLNATIVRACLKCGCQPYVDVLTYNRWRALGYQVRRGEKALHLALVKNVDKMDDSGEVLETRRILGTSAVFCRHQVDEVKA